MYLPSVAIALSFSLSFRFALILFLLLFCFADDTIGHNIISSVLMLLLPHPLSAVGTWHLECTSVLCLYWQAVPLQHTSSSCAHDVPLLAGTSVFFCICLILLYAKTSILQIHSAIASECLLVMSGTKT